MENREPIIIEVVNKSINSLPKYATEDAFAMDLRSNEEVVIEHLETKIIKTGLYMAVPKGYAFRIVPRSGFASKGILVSNSPGTVDSDYRGNVGIIITNLSGYSIKIKFGDRIAQGYLEEKIKMEFKEVNKLSETERGEGGFGSTGVE